MVCSTAAIHAGVSAAHLLMPGLNTGHSAVECVYELHAPKTQLEGGIGRICLGSSFTHKHSRPADLQQGNVLFRAVRQTQLGQDPNRGSHGCTSGFFGSSSHLLARNYRSACVFARSQTNHVKVANRVENEVQNQCFDYPAASASVMEGWLICQAQPDLKIIYNWDLFCVTSSRKFKFLCFFPTDGPLVCCFRGCPCVSTSRPILRWAWEQDQTLTSPSTWLLWPPWATNSWR